MVLSTPLGGGYSLSQQTTPPTNPCNSNPFLAPRPDRRPFCIHVSADASFGQASSDVLRASPSLRIQVRSTQCTLNFGCLVIIHEVLNLSSISVGVLDLSSISIDVLDLVSISIGVLDILFPWPQSRRLKSPVRRPTRTPNVLQRCGNLHFSRIRASPSEPSVSSPNQRMGSHPGTFAIVSSRRATASCTHQTWVWRCPARPTATAPRAHEALLVCREIRTQCTLSLTP